MTYKISGIVRGPINAEDLMPIPGTDWIIACGHVGPTVRCGRLYVVNTKDRSCTELFPYNVTIDVDEKIYGLTDGLDLTALRPHGLDVGAGPDDQPTLYVVNHGGKESVEVFKIDLRGSYPSLTWTGSVTLPAGLWGNDVACLEGGGFVVSSSFDIGEGMQTAFARMRAGEPSGSVAEWSPSIGWKILAGGYLNSANGVAVSSDGK